VTKGEKVDIETLMEAVEGVTEGRTSTASTVITTPLPRDTGPSGPTEGPGLATGNPTGHE
jgi:hypothetical protein